MTSQADTLTKEKASEHLGVSVRTLLREVGAGRIAHLPKRRQSDPTLFSVEELERYRREASATPRVSGVVAPDAQALVRAEDVQEVREGQRAIAEALARLAQMVTERPALPPAAENGHVSEPSIVDLAHKVFLTEREAARYTGLPLALIKGARAKLKTSRHGGRSFLVRREVLEGWARKL